ncbi:signal peptide-containing protein [Theileria equi strain WA]|uniref:Signal peptide-containing protein n=1 Tax=Theileria equi strain WA TaxID=1537102 RepID=L0AXG5_THEEQ|nr:signal peptide-containing protein [Theileria equi strain WA]AFZ79599.1 signal peptide-containing protein [Theileria equi strain WA]|eukprot:XP_004829265.1 signal peptide-containing protein [Theileria equi strain WA]
MKSIALALLFSLASKAGAEVSPAVLDLLQLDKAQAVVSDASHGDLKYKLVTAHHDSHLTRITEGQQTVWEGELYHKECDTVIVHLDKQGKEFLVNVGVKGPKETHHEYFEKKNGSYRSVNGLAYTDAIGNSVLDEVKSASLDISAVQEDMDAFQVGSVAENGVESKLFTAKFQHACTEVRDGSQGIWKAGDEEKASLVAFHECGHCAHVHVTVVHPSREAQEFCFEKKGESWQLGTCPELRSCKAECSCQDCQGKCCSETNLRGDPLFQLPGV